MSMAESFILGGDKAKSERDVRSLVPAQCQNAITITDAGQVMIDHSKIPKEMEGYKGVKLIGALVDSKLKYKYSVDKKVVLSERNGYVKGQNNGTRGDLADFTLKPDEKSVTSGMYNLSETPRSDQPDGDYMPEPGYNGSVIIMDGEFTRNGQVESLKDKQFPVPRNTIVYHELLENYLRTEGKLDYGGDDGAHDRATRAGSGFSKEIHGRSDVGAGGASRFIPAKDGETKSMPLDNRK